MKIPLHKENGFTLIELITVMIITGIISMMAVNMITLPMQSYSDMKQRAELVDIAEITLHRMARDIHHALPNSVRTKDTSSNGKDDHLEILHTIDGGRYTTSGVDAYTTTTAIDKFTLQKELNISNTDAIGSYVVVYNMGADSGADAYQSPAQNRAQITNLTNTLISFPPSIQFPFSSPQSRFMVVDKAITFGCIGSKLYLKQGYSIQAAIPTVSTSDNLLAQNITSCDFNYNPGSSTRPGLVTMEIEITDPDSSELIKLLHQVMVENQP
ncbi:MAG: type II secretion system GspH family protein [gamma proteobacterium symbiont of Taylorina sp.]|nr:type II secretion system GspH family protein [gamma proteobacterium symbiont of Taylorina sp.]